MWGRILLLINMKNNVLYRSEEPKTTVYDEALQYIEEKYATRVATRHQVQFKEAAPTCYYSLRIQANVSKYCKCWNECNCDRFDYHCWHLIYRTSVRKAIENGW